MTIQEAFGRYFERLQRADKRLRSFALHWDTQKRAAELEHFRQVPQMVDLEHPWSEDGIDYVLWQPAPKEEIYDFAPLEKEWGITIPAAVQDYFNTYWFLDFGTWSGDDECEFFSEEPCHILPVVPWEGLETFRSQYEELRQALEDIGQPECQAVPIGQTIYGQVFVNCTDEKVYIMHLERGACDRLTKDLATFIANMRVPGVDSRLV